MHGGPCPAEVMFCYNSADKAHLADFLKKYRFSDYRPIVSENLFSRLSNIRFHCDNVQSCEMLISESQ